MSKSIHTPFAITSIPHPKWGEQVVLLIEQSIKKSSSYKEAITLLPKLWQPQQIYYIDTLPLTPTGKIDRGSCKRIASLHSNL